LAADSHTDRKTVRKDGRKILYRLLLIGVGVVYALVFVLDYILQLHFTFFLLISLFAFVLLTLLYVWLRVAGKEIPEEEELPAASEPRPGVSSLDWPEAVFRVNARTGLTIDANPAALRLFGADVPSSLIGIDLSSFFKKAWTEEENTSFRSALQSGKTATGRAVICRTDGSEFQAVVMADRMEQDGRSLLLIRIQEEEVFERLRNEAAKGGHDDVFKSTFEEGALPMMMLGTDYRIRSANRAFCLLLAYREGELDNAFLPDLFHPEDREDERRFLSRLFRGEAGLLRREMRMLRRTNEFVWVGLSSSLSRDAKGAPAFILTMAENVTQRKRQELAVRESKSRLDSIIDTKEYGILSIDRRHTIQLINPRLADFLFGHTGVVVEPGFNLLDLLPEFLREEYVSLHARAMGGEEFMLDRELRTTSGSSFFELLIQPQRASDGSIYGVTVFAHDITDRKRTEKAMRTEGETAKATTEAKSSFLATMSHEIRTPLNGVIGMGKLLNQTGLSRKQQEYVDSILLSGEALLSVINDILDISKIESSRMELEQKPFALNRCIEETFDLMASKAIEKKLSLQYSIAPGTPAYIVGDITRLRQILMNLVSNAIKFTQRGGVSIHVSRLHDLSGGFELRFEVRDTGVGIPEDRIGRLFQSYSQADVSTARTHGGTGLGLVICKNLVQLMGGEIGVSSKVGEGSVFHFTMKAGAVASTDSLHDIRTDSKRLANAHVLIVSDDRTTADIYANYFNRWNMIPRTISDPAHTEEILKGKENFQIVLLDAQLVSVNPLLVAESVRSFRSKDELPIVLFNADKTGDWMMSYSSEVLSAVIPKNVDRSKVLDILIGVFAIEDHQRARHDDGLRVLSGKLAEQLPARILIAEDNSVNQKLAQNIFEGLGYKPIIVSNGREAIDRLRNEVFDVVFMDVQMPELDGLEATRFIRSKLSLQKRPYIVAMTAFALEGDKEKCMEAGMDDYISKPFMIEEIVDQLQKWGGESVSSPETTSMTSAPGNTTAPAIPENPPVESTSEEAVLPILDDVSIDKLRKMTMGSDPEFFRKVLDMYIEQVELLREEIGENIRYGQLKEMASAAHKLKGSSLNIGAVRLAETCKRIELKGKADDAAGLMELFEAFGRNAAETVAALNRL
jgi:PAS domain S-box-containing protein